MQSVGIVIDSSPQAVSDRPLIAETRFPSQNRPCELRWEKCHWEKSAY